MEMNLPFCPFQSGYFCTFFWSVIPFLEMRASVPAGIIWFGMTVEQVVLISSFGGILTASIVLKLLPYLEGFSKRYIPFLYKTLTKIFEKTRKSHSQKMARLGAVALVLFVAIPLPGSGAWTGVLIAYLFGIPYWRALFLVGIGVVCSALIMVLITLSGRVVWEWITHFWAPI